MYPAAKFRKTQRERAKLSLPVSSVRKSRTSNRYFTSNFIPFFFAYHSASDPAFP